MLHRVARHVDAADAAVEPSQRAARLELGRELGDRRVAVELEQRRAVVEFERLGATRAGASAGAAAHLEHDGARFVAQAPSTGRASRARTDYRDAWRRHLCWSPRGLAQTAACTNPSSGRSRRADAIAGRASNRARLRRSRDVYFAASRAWALTRPALRWTRHRSRTRRATPPPRGPASTKARGAPSGDRRRRTGRVRPPRV